MGRMRMFEIVSNKTTKVFVTGYNRKEEKLFPYKKVVCWIFDEKIIEATMLLTVTRYTSDGCFQTREVYPGEWLVIEQNGDWRIQKTLDGCLRRTWKQMRQKFQEIVLDSHNNSEDLGFIDQKVAKTTSYIDF